MKKPNLKLWTRVRIYPLGINYITADGIKCTYIKWDSGTTEKTKESKILIVLYYIWFRLIKAIL